MQLVKQGSFGEYDTTQLLLVLTNETRQIIPILRKLGFDNELVVKEDIIKAYNYFKNELSYGTVFNYIFITQSLLFED